MPVAKGTLISALVVSGAIALSALAVAAMALMQPRASWVMFSFEVVVLVAGVLGVLIGRGRFSEGPALGLVTLAGVVLLGSVFGYLGGGRILFGIDIRPFVYARAAAAALLAALAAWIVLARDSRATLPLFLRGCALGLPLPLLLLAAWRFRSALRSLPDVAQVGIAIVAFALFTGFLAASVQFLMKAFDIGARRADTSGSTSARA